MYWYFDYQYFDYLFNTTCLKWYDSMNKITEAFKIQIYNQILQMVCKENYP